MIRRFCRRCRGVTDHRTVHLGDGMRKTEWQECQRCKRMSRRLRRKSDWAGV